MSDLEANKAVALRLIEVFNDRRLDLLEDVLHPEFRGRGISAFATEGPEIGAGARRKLYEMFLQAIPDARGEVLEVFAEGDKVLILDRFGGTHRGELYGHPGTGNHIEWQLGLVPGATSTRNTDIAEINALEQHLIDGIKAKDVKQIMSCYSDDLF